MKVSVETPIYDFATEYAQSNTVRLHMPGHKGIDSALGVEHLDITEIDGADNLYDPKTDGIIAKSEANASSIFGCPTFYSTEGSSLAIRSMLFMVKKWALIHKEKPFILAGRNAHKTFVNATALMDIPVEYISSKSYESYFSCNYSADDIEDIIKKSKKSITAVYITTPDYLGNMADVQAIASVCHKNNVLLLVDNAHGAYLRFVSNNDTQLCNGRSMHPMDLGADMCCDSAHKTLPALTGAAYFHISNGADSFFIENVKSALGMFGSTSPSYIILESLDLCNKVLSESYKEVLEKTIEKLSKLKDKLLNKGYSLVGSEPLKLTINTEKFGYHGIDFAKKLMQCDIYPEHYDDEYIVLMVSTNSSDSDLQRLEEFLLSVPLKEELARTEKAFDYGHGKSVLSPYEAIMAESEVVLARESVGRILAEPVLSCPPCVPVYMAGDKISSVPENCEYVRVVKEP